MTVEVKAESLQVVAEERDEKAAEQEGKPKAMEKLCSYREEGCFLSDLKEHEKKALNELKSKLEEAILGNTLFGDEEKNEVKEEVQLTKECGVEAIEDQVEEEEKNDDSVTKECPEECEETREKEEKSEEEHPRINGDVSIWGVPLLPSKGDVGTDVVLLKFLRAREFNSSDAFQMLEKTLQWRKEFRVDSILEEEFEPDLASVAFQSGVDRQGHPICYNIFGVLNDKEVYQKTLGTEEKREQFLRWRVKLMESSIRKLDFKPSGVNAFIQINDLKNSPGPSRKDVRSAVNKAVALLQDNYPEFVAKNIFINVPFWYFAFHSLLSPFLTQRTKSKFVVARTSKVAETLLKYIPIQEIPTHYGGIKRDKDFEFFGSDGEVSEVVIKASSTTSIEIPTPEAGTAFIWDVVVLGWDVNYAEEFVPTDENSYTMIIEREKKMCSDESPVRKMFKNQEPGKIVITIENATSGKKRAFYRYKITKSHV